MDRRIVLAVTGASGMEYACSLARAMSGVPGLELHGIISDAARTVFRHELGADPAELESHFHVLHNPSNIAAAPASGSWEHSGMIVCPCSMASLAAIASGVGSNLIHRSADVCLKERRTLVLVPRETPLSDIHLENMLRARRAGAVIMPPLSRLLPPTRLPGRPRGPVHGPHPGTALHPPRPLRPLVLTD